MGRMNRTNLVGLLVVGAALGAALVGVVVQSTRSSPPPPAPEPAPVDEVAVQEAEPAPPPPPIDVRDRQTDKPNIVMIVACTLRMDLLTPYGGPEQASPFVAQMAADGTRFANAIDAAPWTKAASTALMTGHHPIQVGMTEPKNHANRRRLSSEVTTLAEYLDAAGYETIGLTANPNTNELFGFSQGFDHYVEPQGLWGKGKVHKPSTKKLAESLLPRLDTREDPDAPLYLRLMVTDVHEPIHTTARKMKPFQGLTQYPRRVREYLSMVRQLDMGIEYVWTELGKRGYTADNTILLLVNDHGEGLKWPAKHGHGHGNHVQASTVRMPWVIMGEGVASDHVVQGMASQVDVLPTLLGLAGIEADYAGPGRDWSAQVRGESDRTDRVASYADTWFQRSSRAGVYTEDLACLHDFLDLAEKLGQERINPRTACYDRRNDPMQVEPLGENEALVAQLKDWRHDREADNAAWAHHEDIRVPDDVEAQLEALGYVQGDEELGDEPAHVEKPRRGKGKGKGKERKGKGKGKGR